VTEESKRDHKLLSKMGFNAMTQRSSIMWLSLIASIFFFGCQENYENAQWRWADSRYPQEKFVIPGLEREITAVLDTGAHVSIANKDLLDTLGVKLTDQVENIIIPADGTTLNLQRSEPFIIYPFDDKIAIEISPFVFDPTMHNASTEKNLSKIMKSHPLVLGMEDIMKTHFQINYKNLTSRFKSFKTGNLPPINKNSSLLLSVEIGGEKVKCLVDTGAPDIPGIYIPKNHPKFDLLKSKFSNFYPSEQLFSASGFSLSTHDTYGKVASFKGTGLFV